MQGRRDLQQRPRVRKRALMLVGGMGKEAAVSARLELAQTRAQERRERGLPQA